MAGLRGVTGPARASGDSCAIDSRNPAGAWADRSRAQVGRTLLEDPALPVFEQQIRPL